MSKARKKRGKKPKSPVKHKPRAPVLIHDLYGQQIKTGDRVIDRDGCIYRVGKIKGGDVVLSHAESGEHYSSVTWSSYGKEYIKIDPDKPLDQLEREAFDQALATKYTGEPDNTPSDETALVAGMASKETIEHHRTALQAQAKHLQVLGRFLERKRHELSSILSEKQSQIERISKVIDIIELYLGVHEEVVQFQEGPSADPSEPITLRQQILYMDEEVGNIESGGWDFRNIEDFDNWLADDDHYKKMAPEEKCVVVFKPRRYGKNYGEDPFFNAAVNEENKRSYFLIRNGTNLYRICTNLSVYERLFPSEDEMTKLSEHVREDFFRRDEAEDKMQKYARNALMLQGLIERTTIFAPVPEGLNIMQPDTYGSAIRFIRDDEAALPDGRLRYRDWKKKLNAEIGVGSRILFAGFFHGEGYAGRHSYSNFNYDRFNFRPPCMPDKGVYQVKRIDEERRSDEPAFVCHFNPKDTVYPRGYWGSSGERKKAIPFCLYRGDAFVLNYDSISLEDVEYYIESRIEREDYLDILPTLRTLRKMRLKELKHERGLIARLVLELGDRKRRGEVEAAVEWWKTKNKWKRPIAKDDAKAIRMIRKKLGIK